MKLPIYIISFLTLALFSCKKQDCKTWITDQWCEPIPGSGATGCSRVYDVDYLDCDNQYSAGQTVMYRNDGNVMYYRLFKRLK